MTGCSSVSSCCLIAFGVLSLACFPWHWQLLKLNPNLTLILTLAGLYSKFLAIGLFRLLELVGAKDPKALESVAKSLSLRPEAVNRDLLTYKARSPQTASL